MARLTIEQPHGLAGDEVRRRLDSLSERLSSKYGIDAKWKSATEASFKRTGATGSIHCQPDRVVVQLDLSFLLTPMRDKIESRIQNELERVLAATNAAT